MPSFFRASMVALAIMLTLVLLGGAARADTPNAKALESRLYAPCCYNGTLDIHESDTAHELRKEIETRIDHGDSADAIQADFVARYGEKILAARSDRPAKNMAAILFAIAIAVAASLAIVLRRWTRKTARTPRVRARRDADDLDSRIDAELGDMD